MSAGGAYGGNRGSRPVPPEKGVFPSDHNHACDLEKKEYIDRLKLGGHRNLMAMQDIGELGFFKELEAYHSEDGNISNIKN